MTLTFQCWWRLLGVLIGLFFVASAAQHNDWLLGQGHYPAVVREHVCWQDGLCGMELTNGLLSRRFVLQPAFGTVDLLLLQTHDRGDEESLFRAVEPEATFQLDDTVYTVGGLSTSSRFRAYCNRSELALVQNNQTSTTLHYTSHHMSQPQAAFPWVPGTRHGLRDVAWPPKGVTLNVQFASKHLPGVVVTLHYEIYDGIPALSKWMTLSSSTSTSAAVLRDVQPERLAVNAPYGPYLTHGSHARPGSVPLLDATTDQAHGARCEWKDDYRNSYNPILHLHDEGAVEALLVCGYTEHGMGIRLSTTTFESFRVLLLALDSLDGTRQNLAKLRRTQLLAPHTTENPLFFHATKVDDAGFQHAVDQLAQVGFEMILYSFDSSFDLEDETQWPHVKRQVDYAKSKGLEVGGYDLICLQRSRKGYGNNPGDAFTAVTPDGHLGEDACFASGWFDLLLDKVVRMINFTGLSMLELDGPYGGGSCAAKNHSHHEGLEDSIYQQTRLQGDFFRKLRQLGIYINQPDNFFYQGGNRNGMGYSENQYSLPRWQDLSISRAGLYDDLYHFLPTQGWMFVPLVPYHGGGAAAAFAEHNLAYEFALAQYLGAGTAACYRGEFLYDNSTVQGQQMKSILLKWVAFYKSHRQTLIQPVVHLKRPSLQSWDGWMHVNPWGSSKDIGVVLIFNPTGFHLQESITLPLYYTGIGEDPQVRLFVNEGSAPRLATVSRDYKIRVKLDMPAKSIHTVVVQRMEKSSSISTAV